MRWTIEHLDIVPSTNDTARQKASSGASEGVVVTASRQTAGRGQHGRSWISAAGQGLYFSAILRPAVRPESLVFITLAAAVAVAETIAEEFGLQPDIKWPNDVILSGKKVCGILVESAIEGGSVRYVILGVGLNVGQREFPPDIASTATSLWLEAGKERTPEQLLPCVLERIAKWYGAVLSSPRTVLRRWEQMSTYARNCKVRVVTPEGLVDGVTAGLTDRGTLMVQTPDGKIREIFSGEVRLRKSES